MESKDQSNKSVSGHLNPDLKKQFANQRRRELSISEYMDGILSGDRVILSQAITLIESKRPVHRSLAKELIEKCLAHSARSIRIGITGTPGVGKSTFIETLGQHLIAEGHRLAVLAIDPTSQVSKGSILGDKTRMGKLANAEAAFIRPSAAGDSLGGVARKTREAIILCEAAGFDTLIIETVGVGQSETAVHSMVDFFLLLILPGAGDELQGIKRGIVEMADLIAVNKADGEREKLAKQARQAYRNALHLFPPTESGWVPKVVTCSALSNMGIAEIWSIVENYQKFCTKNGFFERRRSEQAGFWLREHIDQGLRELFYENKAVREHWKKVEEMVEKRKISSFKGAEELLELFLKG
ncbi:MAG: ATPase/protein kinase [Saprospiraceae bacterium]|nr:MAG: ATPase/protein kinase [Saprospiraceae bacterium]